MAELPTPRPLWRWWLFCAALSLSFRTRWKWAGDLMSWCVLPEWLDPPAPEGVPPTKKEIA